MTQIPQTLQRAGWTWSPRGLQVSVATNRGNFAVMVPMRDVEIIFREELAQSGAPLGPSLGAPGSAEGFFGAIGAAESSIFLDDEDDLSEMAIGGRRGRSRRAARRARRSVRRTARKARRAPRRARRKDRRKRFFRGVARGFKKVGNVAKKVVTNPVFRAGFAALATAVPILAPAAAGLEVASRVVGKIDKAKAAAKKLASRHGGKRGRAFARKMGLGATTDEDAQLLAIMEEGAQAQMALNTMKEEAKAGNVEAQRFLGAVVSAKAIMQ